MIRDLSPIKPSARPDTSHQMPAPRKALSTKKIKRASPEEKEAILLKLKALKEKHAARMLELTRTALRAMKEMADIEAAMDREASTEIHDAYIDCVPEFKLTFEAVYAQHAEEADDTTPTIGDCLDIFLAIEKDAADTVPHAAATDAAAAENKTAAP